MNRSRNPGDLLPELSALQHERAGERAPRPLPLFLELVRQVSERDPDLARSALAGLKAYQSAPRAGDRPLRPEIARVRGASLRDHGGRGPPVVLVPSLINPPLILDLDADVSLATAMTGMGRHVILLDWGKAAERSDLSVAGHVEHLLQGLLRSIGEPVALVGYCLGGTMAIAAAGLVPVERLATLAAPWKFEGYPGESRRALADMWANSKGSARSLGALPMEVLQAAFWSLDPERTVRKFAEFGRYEAGGPEARRFVALEDWANGGEPLPFPAASELIDDLFGRDLPGSGQWQVGGVAAKAQPSVPTLHVLAEHDRIAPASTAAPGKSVSVPSGHVGMIVGSARTGLQAALRSFLDPACR